MKHKILVLAFTPTLSHLSRPLAIANVLRERGHSLSFAGKSKKTTLIINEGFKVLPLFEPNETKLYKNIRNGRLRFVKANTLKRMIVADLEIYKVVKPSLILSDGRFSAPISSHIAGIRHVAIVNASSTAFRANPYVPLLQRISAFERFFKGRIQSLLDKLNLQLEMLVFDNTMRIFKNLSKHYGIKAPVTATNCLTGKDMTLMADIPEYFPTINLPDNYHYIGPLTWMPSQPIALPNWWPPAVDNRKLIYFTMGTTGIPEFFKIVAETFAQKKFCVVVTTGGQPSGIDTNPPRLYVTDYLDGDQMMQMCEMVVCHGGNGTIYQALKHGKPIVGIPTLPDQAFNMRRVEELGLGRSLQLRSLLRDPSILIRLVEKVLNDPGIARNVNLFREKLAAWDSVKIGADYIESLLNH